MMQLYPHQAQALDQTKDFKRVALTMEQIRLYNPPPNPTKLTDARATGYIKNFGHECWELDALEPKVIKDLIETEILHLEDGEIYSAVCEKEREEKEELQMICDNYQEAVDFLKAD